MDELKIILVGNPNVGKSVFFNKVTGLGVMVSNYPGTTVEVTRGSSMVDGMRVTLIDLPGIYSLNARSMDEEVARDAIYSEEDAVIIVIADATNLERSLFLTLSLIELNLPLVVAVNLIDEAKKLGIEIDCDRLSEILGVPVVPVIAKRGIGVKEAIRKAVEVSEGKIKLNFMKVKYASDIETLISKLGRIILDEVKDPSKVRFPIRGVVVRLLEGDRSIIKFIGGEALYEKLRDFIDETSKEISKTHGEPTYLRLEKERLGLAYEVSKSVTKSCGVRKSLTDKLDYITTNYLSGSIIMFLTLVSIFFFIIVSGGFIEEVVEYIWLTVSSPVEYLISLIFPEGSLLYELIVNGFLLGIEAGLLIAVPYIITFYLILSILEDTGYLARIAYLLDGITHKMGIHGRAVIPMIVGYGCNVPAIMGTRILETRRERIIASFLITLIPCSARSVVILALVGKYLGLSYAILIYFIDLMVILMSGYLLNRILPGRRLGLVMEIPPYRTPEFETIVKKTWMRFKYFVYEAFPLLIMGSIVISLANYFGLLELFSKIASPITVGLLNLPELTGITLIFGILRKEMTLELLSVIYTTTNFLLIFDPVQMFIFALIVTLYFPCIGTFFSIKKELGNKTAILISFSVILMAIFIGALFNLIMRSFSLL
ncbi:MAG: ferrous iron transport protein B [Candidatus Asgardarchaeia archaeon]